MSEMTLNISIAERFACICATIKSSMLNKIEFIIKNKGLRTKEKTRPFLITGNSYDVSHRGVLTYVVCCRSTYRSARVGLWTTPQDHIK